MFSKVTRFPVILKCFDSFKLSRRVRFCLFVFFVLTLNQESCPVLKVKLFLRAMNERFHEVFALLQKSPKNPTLPIAGGPVMSPYKYSQSMVQLPKTLW